MSMLIANGQLPTALTTPIGTATKTDLWTLRLRNTSGSLAQTVIVEVKRNGGTAVTLPGCVVLPVNGTAVIGPIPVESGDTLNVDTTTGSTVDYDLTGTGLPVGSVPTSFPPTQVQVWDANGTLQTSGTAPYTPVYAVTAAGTTISNSTQLSAGNPNQFSYVTGGNNAANCVKLPVGVAGERVTLKNLSAAATLGVFPQVGAQINANGANAIYNVPAGSQRTFTAVSSTLWYTDLETIA